ncbi:MAG TPA: hypothetical protein PKL30_06000 [Leptospiraceae bacterium]|nr:hypothetical protein [Leptospiraceae bacterium]HNE09240.1 hypothetical protein [Leptospiraceae bacterium]HNG99402.1 hypothetical protein [Leptospiraceae bacterium]HNH55196.1 hypothetical protein [Leptospiraceae bacterium]HNI88732.1 hypothetical protein [Leptospiraceae bacterium]
MRILISWSWFLSLFIILWLRKKQFFKKSDSAVFTLWISLFFYSIFVFYFHLNTLLIPDRHGHAYSIIAFAFGIPLILYLIIIPISIFIAMVASFIIGRFKN